MPNAEGKLAVDGRLDDEGRVRLSVSYGPNEMLRPGSGERFGQEMIAKYINASAGRTGRDCIVLVKVQIAGSLFVRGLFDLWEHVTAGEGRLVCANYPEDYIDTILTLGLSELPGFSLATSEEDAVSQLPPRAA